MVSRILCSLLALLLITAFMPPRVEAQKRVKMDLHFAGTNSLNVVHVIDSTTGATAPTPLVRLLAKGTPGEITEIHGFGAVIGVPTFSFDCFGGAGGLMIPIPELPDVFISRNLSMLFASGTGHACLDLTTGAAEFLFDTVFTGGTGKYAGASGEAVIQGVGQPVSSDGTFTAESGTVVGTIILP